MKIKCKKGYQATKILQFVTEYIEKKSLEYPLLAEDMEIEISLKGMNGEIYPGNEENVYFGEKEMTFVQKTDKKPEYYYNHDALTDLYNRGKYERDIAMFQTAGYASLTCVYIDVVGLHEVNNHLGHKAGDHMLCSIAKGMRKYFPTGLIYRIGGDEFVILCPDTDQSEVVEKISLLKQEMRQQEYEISVGIGMSTNKNTLDDMISYAENAMRYDKADFYRNNGGLRQMRSLNSRLEKLLLEKQDASHFLNVIAPRYKGVYMVNAEKDTCRYIYVPPYFQEMLDQHHNAFLPAMRDYCRELVRLEYHDQFETLFDYDYIQEQLSSGKEIDFTYQKKDGSWVDLRITIYAQDQRDTKEMLWIFLDENR